MARLFFVDTQRGTSFTCKRRAAFLVCLSVAPPVESQVLCSRQPRSHRVTARARCRLRSLLRDCFPTYHRIERANALKILARKNGILTSGKCRPPPPHFRLDHHNTWSRSLLRAAIALHDHEFSPRFRVLRLLTAPREMRLGNICVGRARKGPARTTLCLKCIADGLAVEPCSAELLRREVRPCSLQSV